MEDKINGAKNTGIQDNEEMLYQEVEQQDKKIEAQEKKIKQQKSDKRRKNLIIAFLLVVIIILLLRACDSHSNPVIEDLRERFGVETDVDANDDFSEKSKEEIEKELNEKVQAGYINISMNLAPEFETGTSEGNLMIVNEDINNYPQVVQIYVKDSGELVYESKLIPVGTKIDTGKLLVDLDKGEYPCVAYFHNVDPETGYSLGKAGAELTIKVLG